MKIKLIIFFVIFLLTNIIYSKEKYNYNIDSIKIFLEEYIDNNKTGNYLLIDLLLYKDIKSEEIKWKVTQQWFKIDDYNKIIHVFLEQSRYRDNFDTPKITKLNWFPGKIIKCLFWAWGSDLFELTAKKIGEKPNNWEVIGIGKFKTCDSCQPKDWKLIGVKKIKLKYKEIEIEE